MMNQGGGGSDRERRTKERSEMRIERTKRDSFINSFVRVVSYQRRTGKNELLIRNYKGNGRKFLKIVNSTNIGRISNRIPMHFE